MYSVLFLLFVQVLFWSSSCFSDKYLESAHTNPMWPVINSVKSEEHRRKIANQDSSAYLMVDTGPLENATLFGYRGLIEKFADQKRILDKEGPVSLYLAASLGRLEAIELLVYKGVDPNAEYKDGLTPVYAAVEFGELEALKLLVHMGADINHRAKVNYSILQLALVERREEVVDYLLNSNYEVTQNDQLTLKKYKNKG